VVFGLSKLLDNWDTPKQPFVPVRCNTEWELVGAVPSRRTVLCWKPQSMCQLLLLTLMLPTPPPAQPKEEVAIEMVAKTASLAIRKDELKLEKEGGLENNYRHALACHLEDNNEHSVKWSLWRKLQCMLKCNRLSLEHSAK
jgi:hypothetical protein